MIYFYVKRIGDDIHLYFRPSHTYMEYFNTEEECAAYIEELQSMDQGTFWKSMLFDYKVRMPHRDVIAGIRKDIGWRESEDAYNKAWSAQTEAFYEEYPDLRVDQEIPFDLIQRVHLKKIEEDQKQERKNKERRRAASRIVKYVNGSLVIKRLSTL
ncbi:hypothetical protein D1872_81650 [compost metagenome]